MTQENKELNELKTLVRKFIEEIQYVPFRAVDCNQDAVYNLLNELVKKTGSKNDRFTID